MSDAGTVSRLWRVVVLSAVAYWWGGLVFYASVVIPTAHEVLGSHRRVGFITRQVTGPLNVAAAGALTLLLMNLIGRHRPCPRATRGLLVTWIVLTAAQIGLFLLRPQLNRMLSPSAFGVSDELAFYQLHRAYLIATTLQVCVLPIHLWHAVGQWREHDRRGTQRIEQATGTGDLAAGRGHSYDP